MDEKKGKTLQEKNPIKGQDHDRIRLNQKQHEKGRILYLV